MLDFAGLLFISLTLLGKSVGFLRVCRPVVAPDAEGALELPARGAVPARIRGTVASAVRSAAFVSGE